MARHKSKATFKTPPRGKTRFKAELEIDLDTALIRSGDLSEITGYSVRRLNALTDEGHLPAAINSRHKLKDAVFGVVTYVRGLQERTKDAFRKAATKLKQLDVEERQIDVDKKKETVIEMDEAKRIYARCANATRVRLMAVGSALAPRIVGLTPQETAVKVDELINDALLELQNDLYKIPKRE